MTERRELPETVLFACTMNAIRSPMAAAILQHLAGSRSAVASAGVRAGHPDPYVMAVMDEIGIDVCDHEPRSLKQIGDETYDLILTLSPEAQHHAMEMTRTMAAEVEYWPTLDASVLHGMRTREQSLVEYRAVRDDLFDRIRRRFGFDGGPSM